MTNSSSIRHPVAAGGLSGVGRLIRQICVLRERADPLQATRLQETELANAVRDVRLAQGPDALPESELQAMFATEERRVAEAAILTELLLPRLVEALPASTGPMGVAAARTIARPPLAEVAARVTAPTGSPAIPDLLDAMLAAERNSRRQPATLKPEY